MAPQAGPESTRATILRAAEREFGARGYRRTSVEQVARAAGLSRPLVYRYFGDKPELYRQVVATVLREWHDELVAVAEQAAPTWAHALRGVVRTCVTWAAEREVLRGVLMRDADVAQRIAGPTIEAGRDLLPDLLADLLRRGVAAGAVRADLDIADMAFVIAELTIAASFQAMRATTPEVQEARLEAMVETLLHGVLVGDPSPSMR